MLNFSIFTTNVSVSRSRVSCCDSIHTIPRYANPPSHGAKCSQFSCVSCTHTHTYIHHTSGRVQTAEVPQSQSCHQSLKQNRQKLTDVSSLFFASSRASLDIGEHLRASFFRLAWPPSSSLVVEQKRYIVSSVHTHIRV